MNRVLALLTALVAIIAMTVPSLAMGSRGWISPPIPMVTVQASGDYVRGPCQFTGGKTTSPCRPDIAVLPTLSFLRPVVAQPVRAVHADPMPGTLTLEPSLPPPRRG